MKPKKRPRQEVLDEMAELEKRMEKLREENRAAFRELDAKARLLGLTAEEAEDFHPMLLEILFNLAAKIDGLEFIVRKLTPTV